MIRLGGLLGRRREARTWRASEDTPSKEIKKTEVVVGSGSLVLAALEAVCLFLVSANGMILLLGGASIGLAQGLLFFHSSTNQIANHGACNGGCTHKSFSFDKFPASPKCTFSTLAQKTAFIERNAL